MVEVNTWAYIQVPLYKVIEFGESLELRCREWYWDSLNLIK
jgi:hypothetical protein